MATMRAASGKAVGHRALANSNVSSLRVKPFTALAKPANRAVLAKATAVDAEEDLDFSFSFSDAKKNNEYSAADVEAAMRFYQDGEGSGSVFDADFVTNTFGSEDASFFDDIDNEEAYGDEYIVAGIPEAAPKKRGRGRGKDDGQADDDDLEQAKALDKVKALEDRMVLEAAMEEEFGNASRSAADFSDSKTGVWDWLADLESKDATDAEQLGATRQANRGSLAFLSDSQVTSDIARAKPELFENTEVPTFLELFSNDDVTEDVLAALEDNTDAEGVASTLDDADLARLDALLAQEVPVLDLALVGDANVPAIEDSPELNRQLVDQYIEQLRRVQKSSGASAAEIKALFGDEPLTLEPAAVAESKEAQEETQKLLAAAEPQLTAINIDFDAQAAAIQDSTGEPDEEDETGLERELQALSAIDIFTEEDYPTDAVLEGLEGYLVSAEDYIAQEEARNASIAAAVARGELSPDALAEELEEVADAEDEVVRDLTLAGDDEDGADVAIFEDDDGETWVERIIELTRVTKVVKGGKIMGFRCVAIVGNENGLVGVGCQAGREVAVAVKRTLVDAKRNLVKVPLVGAGTVPHRSEAKYHAARCVVLPASDGTGCIAGGSVRSVLELAGVKNCLAKRLGSRSALNSARATVKALQQMQTLNEVSRARGVPMDQLLLQ